MHKNDQDGFKWVDKTPVAEEILHHDFVSMPFTGLSSPVEQGQVLPLIVHRAGSTGPRDRQDMVEQRHRDFVEKNTKQWGESSPYTVDWNALNMATTALVEGVIAGDVNKVKEALRNHADPETTVSVRDPFAANTDAHAQYVTVPVGVAAVMRGREVMVARGDKLANAPFKEIGTMLLMNGNAPRISVGNAPDGSGGSAIGYKSFGVKLYGDDAGMEGIEDRVVSIPMSIRTAVGSAAPMCIVDGNVPEQTDGLVWGEALPKDARNNYMDLIDTQQSAFSESIARFRSRRASPINASGMKM